MTRTRMIGFMGVGLSAVMVAIGLSLVFHHSPNPTPRPAIRVARPPVPDSGPDLTPTTEVDQIPFLNPQLRKHFLKADAAIRAMDVQWVRQSGTQYGFESWNPKMLKAHWQCPSRTITLEAGRGQKGHRGLGLFATYRPEDSKWAGYIQYSQLAQADWAEAIYFRVELVHRTTGTGAPPGKADTDRLVLSPGDAIYLAAYSDPQWLYKVHVPATKRECMPDEIAQYWRSPETFRQLAASEMRQLKDRGEESIRSGSAFLIDENRPRDGGDPPMFGPRPPSETISETISESIRAEALADFQRTMEQRMALLESDYQAMYQALVDTFPRLPEITIPGESP